MLKQATNCNIAITEFLRGLLDNESNINTDIKEDIYQDMTYKGHKIEKRKDGRWQARIRTNGTQLYFYGKTQLLCLEKLKEYFKEQTKKLPIPKRTFAEEWENWYAKYKKPFYKESTLKDIRSVYRNYLQNFVGEKQLKELDTAEINLFLQKMESKRMREHLTGFLKDFLKTIFKENKTKYDLSEDIRSFHSQRKEGRSLSVEERKKLIDSSYLIQNGELFRFALFSGVRPNELYLIEAEDIQKDFLHIRGTKTVKSDRYIPRFKQLDEVLKEFDGRTGLLFPLSDRQRKKRMKEIRALCGFDFILKDLRTTFATMCAENGVQQNVIAKWLGHSNVSTTNKYYIKVLSDYEIEQIKALESKIDTHFDTQNR